MTSVRQDLQGQGLFLLETEVGMPFNTAPTAVYDQLTDEDCLYDHGR